MISTPTAAEYADVFARLAELQAIVDKLRADLKWCCETAYSDGDGVFVEDVAARLKQMNNLIQIEQGANK